KPFVIKDIVITGNKKTRPYIIERELLFKRGDSVNLSELVKQFDRSKELLMNTALFHEVVVSLQKFMGYEIYVAIDVKERWYIFPIPYFKPVDRNLSEWIKQGFGIDRVNYGFKFSYYNFTGRNDKLKLWLITGYTKQIQFQYDLPYVDKALKHGIRLNFSYSTNKEVNYATVDDQQQFYKDSTSDKTLSKMYNGSIEITYRPFIKTRNTFRIGYNYQSVDSAIINLNPEYFKNNSTKVAFPEIAYKVEYYNVDYIPYAQKGFMGEVSIMKRGFNKDMNMWQIGYRANQNVKLSRKASYSLQSNGLIRFPFDQPYVNLRMFGYGDFYLRGLEKYVVDGLAGMLVKNTLRREVLAFNITSPFNTSIQKIPFQFFAKTYFDAGYSYNKSSDANYLANRMMYTGGFGIDMKTIYDVILRFEYSFNQKGEQGFFFHVKNDF
ncbi:MAG TPA: POTRA domain-containing protein, partial [Chitinophagaceae bacterium]|nr:POTRA domain-containing protein [Chitinophagaceae bacterium]